MVVPRKQQSLLQEGNPTDGVSKGTVVAVDTTNKTIKATIKLEPGATTKFDDSLIPANQQLVFGISIDASMAYFEHKKHPHPILLLMKHLKDKCLDENGLFKVKKKQCLNKQLILTTFFF